MLHKTGIIFLTGIVMTLAYELRQRGRIAGFSLYVSNTGAMDDSTLCYRDGPYLPALNFTTTCITSGRYVIFYNERFDGVIYPSGYQMIHVFTELCEVFVLGCNRSGVYGSNCNTTCPVNCKDNTCHILSGECFGCKPGWTETDCNTTCAEGLYGINCTRQCLGHCRDSVFCNHLTGLCDGGCAYGWYGQYCNQTCNGRCINNATCKQVTGLCDGGCDTGWSGYTCDKVCNDGNIGHDCVNNCSGQCVDNYPCNRQTGHCEWRCKPGYTNVFCNKTCVDSYGEDCRYSCSTHCVNGTCDRFNGSCVSGCVDGFIGDKCNQDVLSRSPDDKKEDTCSIGLSISLGFNALLIIMISVLIWSHYRKKQPGDSFPCWKSPIYEKSTAPVGQESTYQELNIIENQYQTINPN